MDEQPIRSSTDDSERALENADRSKYALRLYVAGNTPASIKAIMNLREVCDEYLKGAYQLEVIDISQQPELAKREQIIATPTLIKTLPLPIRKVIGDLSKKDRVLVGLDLRAL